MYFQKPSIIRTLSNTDNGHKISALKSEQIHTNLPLYYRHSADQISIICGMYHFLTAVTQTLTLHQSAIPMPGRVKMLVFKTDIYDCKYSKGRTIRNNRRWGDNSPKKIRARENCQKKILRAVIRNKKIVAEEATCIAYKSMA